MALPPFVCTTYIVYRHARVDNVVALFDALMQTKDYVYSQCLRCSAVHLLSRVLSVLFICLKIFLAIQISTYFGRLSCLPTGTG